MAAVTGVSNQHAMAGQSAVGKIAAPMAAGNSSTSGSSGDAGTITANDFLTLLVTEMKNQDPTATTDPNEYINQLVNVNSLQQLIQINQTLSTDLTPATSTSTENRTTSNAASTAKSLPGPAAQTQAATSDTAGVAGAIHQAAVKLAPGNLGMPAASSAANRIAQSLSGRP